MEEVNGNQRKSRAANSYQHIFSCRLPGERLVTILVNYVNTMMHARQPCDSLRQAFHTSNGSVLCDNPVDRQRLARYCAGRAHRAAQGRFTSRANPEMPSRAYLKEGSRKNLVSSDTEVELRASDAALMERIMQRDETALATLYDRYAGMLSSVLNGILRDEQAAEEIMQDIFFQLWSSPSRFDASRGSLPGWLLVIARNRAISRLRRHNPAAGEELHETTVVSTFNFEKRRRAAAVARAREGRSRKSPEGTARCGRIGVL